MFSHNRLLVEANVFDSTEQIADRRDDFNCFEASRLLLAAKLVVAHPGAAMDENLGPQAVDQCQAMLDDEAAVGAEQRILPLKTGLGAQQRGAL